MARQRGAQSLEAHDEGILTSRPESPVGEGVRGMQALGLDQQRDAYLYVPAGYHPSRPAPLVLMLHGAGGSGQNSLGIFLPFADANNLILLAPDSRQSTWDVIYGEYGPDVAFIDRALQDVFGRYVVDRTRIAIEGFSDGASYALSLGINNGDLFSDIIAFSPGFMAPSRQEGQPRILITHGTGDSVLRIDATSRRIVPRLERAGYEVVYEEFNGPHTVPTAIASGAVSWFLRS